MLLFILEAQKWRYQQPYLYQLLWQYYGTQQWINNNSYGAGISYGNKGNVNGEITINGGDITAVSHILVAEIGRENEGEMSRKTTINGEI